MPNYSQRAMAVLLCVCVCAAAANPKFDLGLPDGLLGKHADVGYCSMQCLMIFDLQQFKFISA